MAFRFVHAADLHLASPFAGLRGESPRLARLLERASFTAFERIVDLALAEEADALLVAGDVYDAADRSLAAQLAFRNELARASAGGLQVFVAHGNHDPLSGWQAALELPPRVHRFGPEVEVVPLVGRAGGAATGEPLAHVVGMSYPRPSVTESLVPAYARAAAALRGSPFVIGLLHTQVGSTGARGPGSLRDPRREAGAYAPTTRDELSRAGVDYWALGHVHGFQKVLARPVAVYPGTPQGRHPGETGPRGCCLVTVHDRGRVEVEHRVTDAVRWHRSRLDLAAVVSVDDLLELLAGERERVRAASEGRPALWTVELAGRTPLHGTLARLDLERDLAEPLRDEELDRLETDGVWVTRIADGTGRPLDRADLARRRDLVGDVAREAAALAGLPSETLARALRKLLDRRPEAAKIAPELDRLLDGADELLAAAEERALDLLLGAEEQEP